MKADDRDARHGSSADGPPAERVAKTHALMPVQPGSIHWAPPRESPARVRNGRPQAGVMPGRGTVNRTVSARRQGKGPSPLDSFIPARPTARAVATPAAAQDLSPSEELSRELHEILQDLQGALSGI